MTMMNTKYATCYVGDVISVAYADMPTLLIIQDLTAHGEKYVADRRKDAEPDLTDDGWSGYDEREFQREMILNGWGRRGVVFSERTWSVWEK